MKIAITGENGFLGYYLTHHFIHKKKYEVIKLGRDFLNSIDKVQHCDWLIHAAGVNRGVSVGYQNIKITQSLVEHLLKENIKVNIGFTSSIQEDLNNDYGESKRECKRILQEYCEQVGTLFISWKLPNLFGPFGKPNYNSVVATFCHNLVNNIDSSYNTNIINLCYVVDAVDTIAEFSPNFKFNTVSLTVKDLFVQLEQYYVKYRDGSIPALISKFDINLFNTLRSYMPPHHILVRHTDDRGYLIELLKSEQSQTQIFFSTTRPGVTRGNHFHFNKVERFCVLKGKASIGMRKVGTTDKISYIVEDTDNTVVDMPVLYTHNLTNIGTTELVCVFWTNEIFDKDNPDTYFEQV